MTEEEEAQRLRDWLEASGDETEVDGADTDVVGLFRHATGRPAPDVFDAVSARTRPESVARRPMRQPRVVRRLAVAVGLGVAATVAFLVLRLSEPAGIGSGPSEDQAEAAIAALAPGGDLTARVTALNEVAGASRRQLIAGLAR